MPNITLSVSEEVYELIKKHPEIKWSEVARQAISNYANMIEQVNKKRKK